MAELPPLDTAKPGSMRSIDHSTPAQIKGVTVQQAQGLKKEDINEVAEHIIAALARMSVNINVPPPDPVQINLPEMAPKISVNVPTPYVGIEIPPRPIWYYVAVAAIPTVALVIDILVRVL